MSVQEKSPASELQVVPSVIEPFQSFKLSESDDENHLAVLGSTGEKRPDYGYSDMDPSRRGHFLFNQQSKTLIFKRSVASSYVWADHTIYPPNVPELHYALGELKKISLIIKDQINKTQPNIPTGCGIALGFGESSGHGNAENSSTSLRLLNRDWQQSLNIDKTPRDYIRFVYEPYPGDEKFTVDALKRWDHFTASRYTEASGEFNVMTSPEIFTAGDYILYEQIIELSHAESLIKITINPLGSNLDSIQWQKQTVVWNINNKVNATTSSGDPSGRLDFRNMASGKTLTWQELAAANLHIGFVANLAPRLCEFSPIQSGPNRGGRSRWHDDRSIGHNR